MDYGTDLPYLAATDQMGSPWIHQESEQHENFLVLKCLLYLLAFFDLIFCIDHKSSISCIAIYIRFPFSLYYIEL
jgi:hypothetical protein